MNKLQSYSKYIMILMFLILILLFVYTLNTNTKETFTYNKEYMMRKKLREDYDNFDIKKYENHLGLFMPSESPNEVPSKAGLDTFKPSKTSELVAYCDETFKDACITY